VTEAETTFRKAERAYQKACSGLWEAAGATNAPWDRRTAIEIAANAYAEACKAYRAATQAWLRHNKGAPHEGGP
jgi:hypothetical protein